MSATPRIFCYTPFNLPALVSHAEELRGTQCRCDISQQPMSGSHNWAIVLTFDDDSGDWIFRSPRPDNGFSEETNSEMIDSEVASIRASKLNGIPVVDVKSHSGSRHNAIGVPYILAKRAPGFSISSKFLWEPYPEGMKRPRFPLPCLPVEAKEKIMRQLGKITSRILQQPYDKIGSLQERDGEFHVEECLSRGVTWSSRDSIPHLARGPFTNEKEYYEALLSAFCHHVEKLSLDHHVFLAPIPQPSDFPFHPDYRTAIHFWNDFVTVGSKVESRNNRLDYLTAAHLLREAILPALARSGGSDVNKFYLKPPDLSLSNVFVDEEFNVTCIIDWASCTTAPLSTMLIAPDFPHARDGVDGALLDIFRESVLAHSSQYVKEGVLNVSTQSGDLARTDWLFTQLVELRGLQDYIHFMELYSLVHPDVDEAEVRRRFNALRGDEEFIARVGARVKDDAPAEEVREREEAYFKHRGVDAEALARRVTEEMALDRGFVADGRLWKRMGEGLRSS